MKTRKTTQFIHNNTLILNKLMNIMGINFKITTFLSTQDCFQLYQTQFWVNRSRRNLFQMFIKTCYKKLKTTHPLLQKYFIRTTNQYIKYLMYHNVNMSKAKNTLNYSFCDKSISITPDSIIFKQNVNEITTIRYNRYISPQIIIHLVKRRNHQYSTRIYKPLAPLKLIQTKDLIINSYSVTVMNAFYKIELFACPGKTLNKNNYHKLKYTNKTLSKSFQASPGQILHINPNKILTPKNVFKYSFKIKNIVSYEYQAPHNQVLYFDEMSAPQNIHKHTIIVGQDIHEYKAQYNGTLDFNDNHFYGAYLCKISTMNNKSIYEYKATHNKGLRFNDGYVQNLSMYKKITTEKSIEYQAAKDATLSFERGRKSGDIANAYTYKITYSDKQIHQYQAGLKETLLWNSRGTITNAKTFQITLPSGKLKLFTAAKGEYLKFEQFISCSQQWIKKNRPSNSLIDLKCV